MHNTAQSSSDYLPSYPSDKHQSLDAVYWRRERGLLPRDAMLARYMLYMLSSCVCPSVRHTPALYGTKTTKRRITQTTPFDSPGILVF